MSMPLTKTSEVLQVLQDGGRVEPVKGGNLLRLFDSKGTPVEAWQNAIKAAARQAGVLDPAPGTKEHSMRVLNLALQIADHTARSDVEIFSRCVGWEKGGMAYDLNHAADGSDDPEEDLAAARRAAKYIELRGPNAFDFELVRIGKRGAADLVKFCPKKEA